MCVCLCMLYVVQLTRLLTDSLGGNSKTCLIITASPMSSNVEETLSTLRFGSRAKLIKNKPKMNQEKSVQEYKRLLQIAYARISLQTTVIRFLEEDVQKLLGALRAAQIAPPLLHTDADLPQLYKQLKQLSRDAEDESEADGAAAGHAAAVAAAAAAAAAAATAGIEPLSPAPAPEQLTTPATPATAAAAAGAAPAASAPAVTVPAGVAAVVAPVAPVAAAGTADPYPAMPPGTSTVVVAVTPATTDSTSATPAAVTAAAAPAAVHLTVPGTSVLSAASPESSLSPSPFDCALDSSAPAVSPTAIYSPSSIVSPSPVPPAALPSYLANGTPGVSVAAISGSSSSSSSSSSITSDADAAMLQAVSRRVTLLSAANAELSAKIDQLEQQRETLRDALADKEREAEEAAEIVSTEAEIVRLEHNSTLRELDTERAARQQLEGRVTELEGAHTELVVLRKKLEYVDKEYAVQLEDMRDKVMKVADAKVATAEQQRAAAEQKYNDAINELNEQSTFVAAHAHGMYVPPPTAAAAAAAPPSITIGTLTPQTSAPSSPRPPLGGAGKAAAAAGSGRQTLSPAVPSGSSSSTGSPAPAGPQSAAVRAAMGVGLAAGGLDLLEKRRRARASGGSPSVSYGSGVPPLPADEAGKVDTLTAALQRKCDQYIQLQMAHQNSAEHISMLEVLLSESNARMKETQDGMQRKLRELEDKLHKSQELNGKLMETGQYWRDERKSKILINNNTHMLAVAKPGGPGAGAKVVVPLQGGGGATTAAGTSSGPPTPQHAVGVQPLPCMLVVRVARKAERKMTWTYSFS